MLTHELFLPYSGKLTIVKPPSIRAHARTASKKLHLTAGQDLPSIRAHARTASFRKCDKHNLQMPSIRAHARTASARSLIASARALTFNPCSRTNCFLTFAVKPCRDKTFNPCSRTNCFLTWQFAAELTGPSIRAHARTASNVNRHIV